jgi:hypothetical protein
MFSQFLPNLDEVNPVPLPPSGTYLQKREALAPCLDAANGNGVDSQERGVHLLLNMDNTHPNTERNTLMNDKSNFDINSTFSRFLNNLDDSP